MLMSVPGHARLMGLDELGSGDPDELAALWDGSVHPDDRAAYDATTVALLRGEPLRDRIPPDRRRRRRALDLEPSRPTPREGGGMMVEGVAADMTRAAPPQPRSRAHSPRPSASRRSTTSRACRTAAASSASSRPPARAAAAGTGPRPAVLLLDLDRFKAVNDATATAPATTC